MKKFQLKPDSEIELICSECHCVGSFTVSVTCTMIHCVCNECESLYSMDLVELVKDPYAVIDDAGALIQIKKTG